MLIGNKHFKAEEQAFGKELRDSVKSFMTGVDKSLKLQKNDYGSRFASYFDHAKNVLYHSLQCYDELIPTYTVVVFSKDNTHNFYKAYGVELFSFNTGGVSALYFTKMFNFRDFEQIKNCKDASSQLYDLNFTSNYKSDFVNVKDKFSQIINSSHSKSYSRLQERPQWRR